MRDVLVEDYEPFVWLVAVGRQFSKVPIWPPPGDMMLVAACRPPVDADSQAVYVLETEEDVDRVIEVHPGWIIIFSNVLKTHIPD